MNELYAYANVFGVSVGQLLDRAAWASEQLSTEVGAFTLSLLEEVHAELNWRDETLRQEATDYRSFSDILARQIQTVKTVRSRERHDENDDALRDELVTVLDKTVSEFDTEVA